MKGCIPCKLPVNLFAEPSCRHVVRHCKTGGRRNEYVRQGNEQGAAKFLAVAALRCESLWASCANQTDDMRMLILGRRRSVPSNKKGPRAWGGALSRRDRSGLGRLARSRLVTTQSIFTAATRAALLCSELYHSVAMLQCERQAMQLARMRNKYGPRGLYQRACVAAGRSRRAKAGRRSRHSPPGAPLPV
jgi:hypothetical protein